MVVKVTNEVLQTLKTAKGGYSRETIELLGLPWPPPKGWKKLVVDGPKANPKRRRKRKARREREIKRTNFYKTAEWARIRYDALKKSDGKCECCGRTGKDAVLHVDHIKSVRKHPELRLDPDNLQVLCSTCNWGKGVRDETDWREPDLSKLMGEKA